MERKIDEIFEFEGHKLKVVGKTDSRECKKCFFYNRDCSSIRDVRGFCSEEYRADKKCVIFVEAKDEQPQKQAEQPQDEQPQKLNLSEILKYCPIGTKFWSPLLGEVELSFIRSSSVSVRYYTGGIWDINSDGTMTLGSVTSPEIMLFPSREQRDWSKVKYEPKKERFDPKTLKAFDRVIVWDEINAEWFCANYSHRKKSNIFIAATTCGNYLRCIPYNDDTKYLVGTKEEAPEYYRYWED